MKKKGVVREQSQVRVLCGSWGGERYGSRWRNDTYNGLDAIFQFPPRISASVELVVPASGATLHYGNIPPSP